MPMSTKRKASVQLAAPVVKSSAKLQTKSTIDESRTSVSGADALPSPHVETIEISSDSEEDLSDQDTDEAGQVNGEKDDAKPAATGARVNGKQVGRDNADAEESDGEPTSPSFGELLRGNEAIEVPALGQQPGTTSNAAVPRPQTTIVPPSHKSLTTVLNQALRTDDNELLELCLSTADVTTIRNTIERMDGTLASSLLTKLASRMHRRPGRAENLMMWLQWTLVAHGGALASQPPVVHGLSSLQRVLAERAKGLNSLLALKGKLDMLEGQIHLRKRMRRGSGLLQQKEGHGDDEDVVWVEGETDAASDKGPSNRIDSQRKSDADGGDEDDDVQVANGFVGESEDEQGDSDVEVGDDSSSHAEEPVGGDEVDHDVDESMGEDEESDVEADAPPSKAQKVVARSSLSKRK